MLENCKIRIIFITGVIFFSFPFFVFADYLGQRTDFYVDPSYDLAKREKITATLQKTNSLLYFYIDDQWWEKISWANREVIKKSLEALGKEFEEKIYPTLTSAFGSEWKPGIDNDSHITILIHPMIGEASGYFNLSDEYPKLQNPRSNEKEMVYLNTDYIIGEPAKSFLAHEFIHLITFNQKDRIFGVSEETWLNEARAEYSVTLLGYDDIYQDSNLQRRVRSFLNRPNDSLTEWLSQKSDYGVINIFIQYLVDHYGIKILRDSLKSSKVGISSIDEALTRNGFKACPVDSERSEELCGENFSQIFIDWTIAVLINNCEVGEKYCYLNQNLKNLRITPQLNYLPQIGESVLSVINTTKDWAGNWQKIIGGKDILKLEFTADSQAKIQVPYLVENSEGKISINFFQFDETRRGIIYIPDFSTKNKSLTIIPISQTKTSGFNGEETLHQFSFAISTIKRTPEEEERLKKELLSRIEVLKAEIKRLQEEIDAILGRKKIFCQKLTNDLYFDMEDNPEVKCLQEFLKSQGPEIYPEGLVTGNFLSLTQQAVIRFQEKYSAEILKPLNLEKGTGYVGSLTRAKINQLLGF